MPINDLTMCTNYIFELAGKLNFQKVFLTMCAIITYSFVSAQCPVTPGCNSNVQISLDNTCEARLIPSLLLEGDLGTCIYQVRILDANNKILASSQVNGATIEYPLVDASFIGSRFKGEVFFIDDNGVEVSCWGWFTVEDKLPPTLNCLSDFSVSCKDDLSDLFTRESVTTFCLEGDGTTSNGLTTFNLVTNDGSPIAPYELISSINLSAPLTGSGTNGFFSLNGMDIMFPNSTGSGTPGVYDLSAINGLQILDLDDFSITLPTFDAPAPGLCFDVSASSFALFDSVDNCSDSEVIILRDELDENECGPQGFTAERIIEYVSRDNSGLTSETCQFLISFESESLAEVAFPSNIAVECNAMNNPGTMVTGVPTIGGCDLSLLDNLCKFNISFEDDTTSTCGSNFTIRRTWSIIDWCAADSREAFQTINVSDTEPPVIQCPAGPIVLNTDNGCTASPTFNPFTDGDPTALRMATDCSGISAEIYIETSEGFNPFSTTNLPADNYTFRYIVSDECDNSSNCDFGIQIVDNAEPIAVCDQFTVVSLDEEGWGRIFGPSLDDGSFDQCGGPVTLSVRRLSTPCSGIPDYDRDDLTFGPYVQFCCAETNDTVPVMLRVTDSGGMSSTCNVNVVVQDKHGNFSLGCPQGIIDTPCLGTEAQLRALFTVPSPINSCGSIPSFIIEDGESSLDECGVGSLSRTYIAVIGQDTTNMTCVQTINVSAGSNLSNSSFIAPPAEVSSPAVNCSNFMEDTGDGPQLRAGTDLCSDVGFLFDDEAFFGAEGYCVKVIRTWTAIDLCNHNVSTGEGVFGPWIQTIKVSDTEGPELSDCPEDITVSASSMSCDGFVDVSVPSATDLCLNEALNESDFTWSITGDASLSGAGNTASQTLPVGAYMLTWSVSGACGATSTCAPINISVQDNGSPTVYCRTNVTTVISTSSPNQLPSVVIWASDFDLNSTDDCDDNISVSFSPTDDNDISREFGCHQLGFQTVQVYFTDSSGNQDFCTTSVNIQANGDICDTIGQRDVVFVGGEVFTEQLEMVEKVDVGLENMANGQMNLKQTDVNGQFAFDNIIAENNYRIEVSGDSDYLNGIDTRDLIRMQRHILGIETLDSPYKIIAADINNSSSVDGLDIVELRKLILGIYTALPQNDSWRFVEESQEFANENSPWPFNEEIELYGINQDMMDNDFIAVKVGDVDGTALVSDNQVIIASDNSQSLILNTELHEIGNNEYLIPVYLSEPMSVFGMQMDILFDDNISVTGIESGKILMEGGYSILVDNHLTISYHEKDLFAIDSNEALFYLTVKSDSPLKRAPLTLSSDVVNNEIYGPGLRRIGIADSQVLPTFVTELFQNTPNPWDVTTDIVFELPTTSEVNFKILDLNGRIIYSNSALYGTGRNVITLSSQDLPGDGVFYYQIETSYYSASKKMVKLK